VAFRFLGPRQELAGSKQKEMASVPDLLYADHSAAAEICDRSGRRKAPPRMASDDSIASVPRRAALVGLAALYVAAWTLGSLALKTKPSDLDLYFWPSAETVIGGHPLLIYSAHLRDAYPNANGPLGLVTLLPIAALANAFGWAGNLGARAALTGAMMSIVLLLLAYQAVRLVVLVHGSAPRKVIVACSILLAPALWFGVIDYGHVEQPVELCFVLLAVGFVLRSRNVLAGVALGASVLARNIAALSVIPLALLPLATRRMKPGVMAVLACVLTVTAGLAPFVLAGEPAVTHSLLGYRGNLPIGGGSFWVVARQTSFAGLGQFGDVYLAAAVAGVVVAITLWRRPGAGTTGPGLFGLLTVASACFPLFAKTVFPYYLIEPYVFGALWWLARPCSARNWRVLVPLLLTADVFLAKAGTTLSSGGLWVAEGVTSSAIVAVAVALVTADLFQSSRMAQPDRLPALG
jgi:hypothetical protein